MKSRFVVVILVCHTKILANSPPSRRIVPHFEHTLSLPDPVQRPALVYTHKSPVPVCPVVIVTDTVHEVKVRTRCAANRTIKAVPDTAIYVPHEESFKVQIHLEQVLQKQRATLCNTV